MMISYPYMLALIPILVLILWLVVRKDFVPSSELDPERRRQRMMLRKVILVGHTILIVVLVLALAKPYTSTTIFSDAQPQITVLIDNSTSMEVLSTEPVQRMISDLQERAPVKVRMIGSADSSLLGAQVLGYLEQNENLLLVTDGRVTDGPSLEDVAVFASGLNASISAIALETSEEDAAVTVRGPRKAIAGVNTTFEISVTSSHGDEVPIQVLVDGESVAETEVGVDPLTMERSFSEGSHVIEARILSEDYFAANNVYRYTVAVQPKPSVLYVSGKQSGLWTIVDALYDAQRVQRIPSSLSGYSAVIINDVPYQQLGDVDALSQYLLDGNGVLVVGGENSFDAGGYRGTAMETMLPVRVGAGDRTQGGANIVVALDLSGSTRGAVQLEERNGQTVTVETTREVQSLQKALAIAVISDLNPSNSVGVLGFTYPQGYSPSGCSGACVIQPIQQLGREKQALVDKVARVNMTGGTSLGVGMEGSLQMLQERSGSKNIIFISDGISTQEDEQRAFAAAESLAAQGGRVYAVQVGDSDKGALFMQRLARAGSGAYFKATQANRLAILFGEPVDIDQGDAFDVHVVNGYHFITDDDDVRSLSAVMYGYNQVAPKTGALLLVASVGGDPILTAWNYGIGRVAALTAFNGPDLGALLSGSNSKLLVRSINWAIGDPERNNDFSIDVADGHVGRPVEVLVRSPRIPQGDLAFAPRGRDTWAASIEHDEPGVYSLMNVSYAVNYAPELSKVGMAPDIDGTVEIANGRVFEPGEIDEIVEHVRTVQKLQQTTRHPFVWPLIVLALVVLLVEIVARRVVTLRGG